MLDLGKLTMWLSIACARCDRCNHGAHRSPVISHLQLGSATMQHICWLSQVTDLVAWITGMMPT